MWNPTMSWAFSDLQYFCQQWWGICLVPLYRIWLYSSNRPWIFHWDLCHQGMPSQKYCPHARSLWLKGTKTNYYYMYYYKPWQHSNKLGNLSKSQLKSVSVAKRTQTCLVFSLPGIMHNGGIRGMHKMNNINEISMACPHVFILIFYERSDRLKCED